MVFIQTLTCSVLTGGVSGRVRAELRRRVAYPAVGTAVQAGEGLYGPGPQTGEPTRWSGVWGAGRGFWGDVRGSGGLFGGLGAAVDHHVRTILFGHTCKMNVGAGIVSYPTSLVSRRRLG